MIVLIVLTVVLAKIKPFFFSHKESTMITYIPNKYLCVEKAVRNAVKKAKRIVREYNRNQRVWIEEKMVVVTTESGEKEVKEVCKRSNFLTGEYKHSVIRKRTIRTSRNSYTVTKEVCSRVVVWMENTSDDSVLETLNLHFEESMEVPDEYISSDEESTVADWVVPYIHRYRDCSDRYMDRWMDRSIIVSQ